MFAKVNRFSLATMLVMVNVLCIGLTLTITQWLGDYRIAAIDQATVQLFLIILITFAIFCMSLVLAGKQVIYF